MANIKVTQSVFNAVKTLLKGGASVTECAKYMKIGMNSAYIIRNSDSYEEYLNARYALSMKNKQAKAEAQKAKEVPKAEPKAEPQVEPQTVEQKQTIVVQASHYMLEEQKKTNELLTLISNKLAFIIDELVGVKPGA